MAKVHIRDRGSEKACSNCATVDAGPHDSDPDLPIEQCPHCNYWVCGWCSLGANHGCTRKEAS